MKTLEFKLDLNQAQQATIASWLDSLRWVWNEGLSLLLEYQTFKYYEWLQKQIEKQGGSFEGIEYRYLQFSRRSFSATCRIGVGKTDALRAVQPLPIPRQTPRLKKDNYLSLTSWIAKKRYPHIEALKNIPMAFVRGTLKSLTEAWKAYQNKQQTQSYLPKFKSFKRGDRVTSLHCLQPEQIGIIGDRVKCPGSRVLGSLKVVNKQLSKRWGNIEPRTLIICQNPSGYYLQLTGEFLEKPLPKSDKACGLDVGLQYIYSDDDGKQIDPPKYYRQAQKRLRRLQRKLARQEKNSKNREKTNHKIARLHEKIANQRRTFNHKISTYVVRKFGGIAVEDIKLTNLNRRPKPKPREDGQGYERNGAKAKSGLNKSFADAGLGQLLTMIETKAKAKDREFVKVPPHYTSQDCPQCGHRQKKALSQRTHQCSECGYVNHRDIAAAINIRDRADFVRSYRACARNVKPVESSSVETVKQESTIVERNSDVIPTPPTTSKERQPTQPETEQYHQLSLFPVNVGRSCKPTNGTG